MEQNQNQQVDLYTETIKSQVGDLYLENIKLKTEVYEAREYIRQLTDKIVELTEIVNALKDKESEKKDEK